MTAIKYRIFSDNVSIIQSGKTHKNIKIMNAIIDDYKINLVLGSWGFNGEKVQIGMRA